MKLTLTDPRFLKDSILIISELVNEVNFKVDKDKIELIAMDPANVAMVVFKLLSSSFAEYDVKDEKTIGLNLMNFTQILKRVKPSDILTLELDEEKNRLNIGLKGNTTRHFSVALLDIEEREQRVPNLKFSTKVETNSIIFNDAIEDMDIIADSLTLAVAKGHFIVSSDGSLSSAKVLIADDEETQIATKEDDIKAKYSVEYLKKIIKGAKLSNSVSLEFAQDYPLRIEYRIIDRLSLMFILAPRVAND